MLTDTQLVSEFLSRDGAWKSLSFPHRPVSVPQARGGNCMISWPLEGSPAVWCPNYNFCSFREVRRECDKTLRYRGTAYPVCLPFLNPLTPELNPFTQRCLTRFFTGDFASWTVHLVSICVRNQQMQQLFIRFINYVWWLLHVSALHCHLQGAFLAPSERYWIEE
jgi:hypothetical protein